MVDKALWRIESAAQIFKFLLENPLIGWFERKHPALLLIGQFKKNTLSEKEVLSQGRNIARSEHNLNLVNKNGTDLPWNYTSLVLQAFQELWLTRCITK